MKKAILALATVGVVSLMAADGAAIYKKCAVCHGADGKMVYAGKVPAITSLNKEEIIASLNAYKAGTENKFGMGAVMSAQAKLNIKSDADAEAVAEYIETLR
ncbi:MAG: c-type cytochrome [Campylobacterales bacterium]